MARLWLKSHKKCWPLFLDASFWTNFSLFWLYSGGFLSQGKLVHELAKKVHELAKKVYELAKKGT